MTTRRYGQYCGLAYALDLVGERWALLIVRDLMNGPKRFGELASGLPGIPSNVLSARLKELEENGIVVRRVPPRPATSVVYDLSEYGHELEEVVLRLGLWGSRSLGVPHPDDALTTGALLAALRAAFQPDAAAGVNAAYELRVGPAVIGVRIVDGELALVEGPIPEPDLVIETDHRFTVLLRKELSPAAATRVGGLRVSGNAGQIERFLAIFELPPARSAEEQSAT
jgi:DNA-binding HxlR family transcriptional regulator